MMRPVRYLTTILWAFTALFFICINVGIAGESLQVASQQLPVVEKGAFSVNVPDRVEREMFSTEELLDPLQRGTLTQQNQKEFNGDVQQPSICLAQLEEAYHLSPDEHIARTELEEKQIELEQKKNQSGLKLFAGAGVGAYRTPVTDTHIRDYRRGNIKLGLSYPLLGSRAREQFGIHKAEARIQEKELEISLIQYRNLGILRSTYIDYWASQKKIELCQVFLANEQQVKNILGRRVQAGYLLDADRQQFMTAFSMVRRNQARSKALHVHALNVLNLMTNKEVTSFGPEIPKLPEPCLNVDRLKETVLTTHPEIHLIRKQAAEQLALQEAMSQSDIKADVSLTGIASSDLPESQFGYGLVLNFNMQLPAGINNLRTARKDLVKTSSKKSRQRISLRCARLTGEAEEAVYHFWAARENIQFALHNLKAAMESMRENQLRSVHLQGDTIEQLQQSRYHYLQSAMTYIDSLAGKLKLQVQLLQFAPDGCSQEKLNQVQ